MDAIGNVGWVIEVLVLIFSMCYLKYYNKRFRNDMVHKGLMITGKFGVRNKEATY